MTKYINTAETAKLVRKALKESFPGVKFSVRSSTYSGGASISVSWTDGPTSAMVDSVAETFSGSYFDGMTDFKGSLKHMIDGELVDFAADSVRSTRNLSREFLGRVLAAGVRTYGTEMFADVRITDSCDGQHAYFESNDYEAARLLREIAYKRSTYLAPRKSKTAGKVIFLGNDGYSDIGALQIN